MNWKNLDSPATLDQIKQASHDHPVVIFKHSTRCSISSVVLGRLESAWSKEALPNVDMFYLDLIQHRDVSRQVAETFGVTHQSPQMLIIHQGESIFDASHMSVSYQALKNQLMPAEQ